MLAHAPQYQKNACGKHLPIPHPNHNCCNRAPEHNVPANFSMFWTCLVLTKGIRSCGIEALSNLAPHLRSMVVDWMDATAMPATARLTMAENHITTKSIGSQLEAECWYEQEERHKHDPQPPFPSAIGAQPRHVTFLTRKPRSEKTRKTTSDRVPCLDKPVLVEGLHAGHEALHTCTSWSYAATFGGLIRFHLSSWNHSIPSMYLTPALSQCRDGSPQQRGGGVLTK